MKHTTKSAWRALLGIICLLGHAAAAERSGRGASADWTLSFTGFGPIKIGMTVREAERLTKVKLDEELVSDAAECHYASNESELPGVAFMVLDGKIARVDVVRGTYRTVTGARIGMTEGDIKRLYPHIEVERHHYDDAGHYLVLTSRDQQYGIVFETNGKVVTQFRGGRREPVGYVEGCL